MRRTVFRPTPDVVVCQSVLAERIAAAAKGAELIVIDNFLSDPGLDALFARLESAKPTAAGPGTVSCGESDSDMSDARLAETTPSCGVSGSRPAQSALSCDQSVCGAPRPIRPRNPKKPHPPPGRRSDGAILATRKYPGRTACGAEGGGDPAAGELLVAGGYARPEYVDAMLRREELATTCLGMGLAIPHGTSDAKERVLRSASWSCNTPTAWISTARKRT